MEKQRNKTVFRSCRRFLIFLLLFLSSLTVFSQQLTLDQIKRLRVTPEAGQNLYSRTDIKFTVIIPNTPPSQVQVISGSQKQDITFHTMRKIENYEQKGTAIELWYNFSYKGTYTLTPLTVMIKNHKRSIEFETVTITDDPATMNPRIVLSFEDGTKVYTNEVNFQNPLFEIKTGTKIRFTVNLQYATQLTQFNWEIPKDSIFTCTKQYEFTEVRHRERVYSHELIPIASFEWIGLVTGPQSIPRVRLNTISYNGTKSELILPEIFILFTEGTEASETMSDSDIFDEAFFQESAELSKDSPEPLSREECQELSDLYTKERNLFFTYFKARNKRVNFQKEHKIIISDNQIFPSVLLYIFGIIILISMICLIISILKKHKIRTLIFVILMIFGIAALVYGGVKRHEPYGISCTCKMYSIPQENAESVSEVTGGTCVRILERTEKWYYIEVGESGGWCAADNIFLIK